MKRTITGRTATGPMSLGDLRQFVSSLDGLPDAATVRARVSFRKHLRSITVEEDDVGFDDYIRAVGGGEPDTGAGRTSREAREARAAKEAKTSSSV